MSSKNRIEEFLALEYSFSDMSQSVNSLETETMTHVLLDFMLSMEPDEFAASAIAAISICLSEQADSEEEVMKIADLCASFMKDSVRASHSAGKFERRKTTVDYGGEA